MYYSFKCISKVNMRNYKSSLILNKYKLLTTNAKPFFIATSLMRPYFRKNFSISRSRTLFVSPPTKTRVPMLKPAKESSSKKPPHQDHIPHFQLITERNIFGSTTKFQRVYKYIKNTRTY